MFGMVLRVIPAFLWLSILTYFGSVGGLFLGVVAAAMHVHDRRPRE